MDILAEDRRLWAEATPERLALHKLIGDCRIVDATHIPTGTRSRFRALEASNVGPGWVLMDTAGKLKNVVSDDMLTDVAPAAE